MDCSYIWTLDKNDNFLISANIFDWVTRRNSLVVTFLLPIIIANHDISYKECTIFAFAIDNIYSLITKNLLLSFSFEKNLLTYYLCANKLVCILNASCGSEGSYSTILNFIADHPTEGVNVPSSKDVVTFFLITIKCLQEIGGFI